jgi:hypothetical protein
MEGNRAVQRLHEHGALQASMDVSQPGDREEREAERVATKVMEMDDLGPTVDTQERAPLDGNRVQEICSRCRQRYRAGKPLHCAECEGAVQPKADGSDAATGNAGVQQQLQFLQGGGRPLPRSTRSFFEPRFGRDFSEVRIHTGHQADAAARSLNATAFTFGTDIVFRSGAFRANSDQGRRLIAHELSHVVQQTDPNAGAGTVGPDRVVQRRVDNVNCTPGTHGVPDTGGFTPRVALDQINGRAVALASATSNLVALSAEMLDVSGTGSGGAAEQAFRNRFGLPPRRNGKFLNRLTTETYDTRAEAQQSEMRILAERFGMIADILRGPIDYDCVAATTCSQACSHSCDAFVSTGQSRISLCPSFWNDWFETSSMAALMIHETAHMIWAGVGHGANFSHAECYASFVGDLFGISSGTPSCPQPTMRFPASGSSNTQNSP